MSNIIVRSAKVVGDTAKAGALTVQKQATGLAKIIGRMVGSLKLGERLQQGWEYLKAGLTNLFGLGKTALRKAMATAKETVKYFTDLGGAAASGAADLFKRAFNMLSARYKAVVAA